MKACGLPHIPGLIRRVPLVGDFVGGSGHYARGRDHSGTHQSRSHVQQCSGSAMLLLASVETGIEALTMEFLAARASGAADDIGTQYA